MSFLIAVTGKGGVGKTTISALLVTRLIALGKKPVLAVDADPNTCLDSLLGVTASQTVGSVREETREIAGNGLASGISKQELLELKIGQCLVEARDFDLIAMGRPEGPGCYCYANSVLKSVLSEISSQYPFVVLDNEAGLENLSRRIVQKVDLLIMVSDTSYRGLETIRRLHSLSKEMEIHYDRLAIVLNRMRDERFPPLTESLKNDTGADIIIGLPEDIPLADMAETGNNIFSLPHDNPLNAKIDAFLENILIR